MKEFINVSAMTKDIYDIYNDAINSLTLPDDERVYIDAMFDDETLMDMAKEHAIRINKDMEKYLNSKSHHIPGNFMSIDFNYPMDTGREVSDMVKRLNDGDTSELADDDRDYLCSFVWRAFGTYGVEYNFTNEVCELLCEYENQ